jgi:holin-like protein
MAGYLAQFITVLSFFLLGNLLSGWLNIPVPGSMIGMGLLFGSLQTGIIKLSWVEAIARLHIKHISLLFIPFTVGVFHYTGIFKLEGFKLVLTLVLSSLAVFMVTALIAELFEWKAKRGD